MPTPGPMNPLQVQLFTGAAAGRRARFDRSPITFGREAGNMLVVEDATVSRRHGEIRFEGGLWLLVNLSENGTRLNRKNVTDKPMPIRNGDEVFVGGKLLFNITIEPVEGVPLGDQPLGATAEEAQGATAAKKKTKLWIGIGSYMLVMLLLVVFFSTLGKKGPAADDPVPELKPEQIAALIRRAPSREPTSEIRYRESIAEATRLFARRATSLGGYYQAHHMFQVALSYSGREDGTFPPENTDAQFQYRTVQQELITRATEAYLKACNHLSRNDNENAYKAFDEVKQIFPDGNNPFYENVQDKQNVAVKRLGKKKIKNK